MTTEHVSALLGTRAGPWFTPREVADILRVSIQTLSHWRVQGSGPQFIKLGDGPKPRIRYPAEPLAEFVKNQPLRSSTSEVA